MTSPEATSVRMLAGQCLCDHFGDMTILETDLDRPRFLRQDDHLYGEVKSLPCLGARPAPGMPVLSRQPPSRAMAILTQSSDV